jgi:transposase InsO family protein
MSLRGAVRGKAVKTTIPDTSVPCPRDKVNRQFRAPAPNRLWVSDFTHVSTWQGFAHVAVVIDTFANRIVGWKVSRSSKTDFALDALEQALCARSPVHKGGLIHHSDRGSQYLSIRYTERLAKAGIEPSGGSVGDACEFTRGAPADWLRPSTAFARPRSFAGDHPGAPSTRSRWQP